MKRAFVRVILAPVLALKAEGEDALIACGGPSILGRCVRRDRSLAGNPAQGTSEIPS